jgi:hypothetical protein
MNGTRNPPKQQSTCTPTLYFLPSWKRKQTILQNTTLIYTFAINSPKKIPLQFLRWDQWCREGRTDTNQPTTKKNIRGKKTLLAKPKQQNGGKRLFCKCKEFRKISRRISLPLRKKPQKLWPKTCGSYRTNLNDILTINLQVLAKNTTLRYTEFEDRILFTIASHIVEIIIAHT